MISLAQPLRLASAALAVIAAVALTHGAHAQNAVAPQSVNNVGQPASPGWTLGAAGWYTDGGRQGNSYPYRPGFTPVPAPPPSPTTF